MLVRLDRISRFIVNANHSVMGAAAVLRVIVINEIFEAFRNSADDLQARGDALWKENEKEIETQEGANGSNLACGVPKSARKGNAQSLPAAG